MQGNSSSPESSPESSPGFITSLSYTIVMYVLYTEKLAGNYVANEWNLILADDS